MSNAEDNCGQDAKEAGEERDAELEDIRTTYKQINGQSANYGSFRHGTITEMVRPTDPSQALIQSSGNYVIHAVGLIVIAIFWEKGGLMQCHKQAWPDKDENNKLPSSYGMKLNPTPALTQSIEDNFLNVAVGNMLHAHIACFTLLILTKLDILCVQSTARGLKSIFTFTSICIYLWYMFKAEFALRQYRPQYKKQSTKTSFMLLDAVWPKKASMVSYAADEKILGMVCSQSHEGNSMVILWLELLFFLSNIFIILGSLIGAWFDETNVKEPKASDKILIKDYRNCDKSRKNPGLHIFSLQGFEQLQWGNRLELPGVDQECTKTWKVGDLKPVELKEQQNKIAVEEDMPADMVHEDDEDEEGINEGGDDDVEDEEVEGETQEAEELIGEDDDNFQKVKEEVPEPVVDPVLEDKNTEEKKAERKEMLSAQALEKIKSMQEVIKGFQALAELPEGQIKLYRIKANDLDDQIRQAVNDTDTLKFLYDGDISFRRFQAYMFFVSAAVFMFSNITTAAYMDVVLMRSIDDHSAWKGEKTYCAQQWDENNYKGPIKVLMLSHMCLFIGLSISSKRQELAQFWPIVFDYTKVRTSDLTEEFPKQFAKNFVALLIFIGATTAVAFVWLVSIKIDLENNPECTVTTDRRRHSICSAWLLTDTIMSFLTLFMIYFEYKVGEQDFIRKYRSRIMFAHSFSYEKFALTDGYEHKAEYVKIGLDQRLKDAVIKEHKEEYLKCDEKLKEIYISQCDEMKVESDKAKIKSIVKDLQSRDEELTDEEKAKLTKYKFLQRKFEAQEQYPIKIKKFIKSIQNSVMLLDNTEDEAKEPVDPRSIRYFHASSDVYNKDENGLTDALRAEIDDNVSDLVKTLSLGGSMYDFAFWTFFTEFNPLMLFEIKMKIFMTFGVHMLVVIYAFVDKNDSIDVTSPYYGKIGIQLVRMVCAILLHLQMFPQTDKAIQMATFIIKNPGRFKSETVAFPAVIALVKLLTSLIVEFGSLALFLYINSEMTLIKFYTQLAIIGAIETNMAAIMTTVNLTGEMDKKPIQYPVKSSTGNSVVSHAWKFLRNQKDENPGWVTIFDQLCVFILSLIIAPMSIFYILYYYLIMFVPLLQMMISANTRRYAPKDATKADAFPLTTLVKKPDE